VLAAGHEVKSVDGVPNVEAAQGKRSQRTLLEGRDQESKDLLDALGTRFHQIKGAVRDAREQRRDLRWVAEIGLANLDETTARANQRKGEVDKLTSEAVENEVKALVAGGEAELGSKVQGARAGEMISGNAERKKKRPLVGMRSGKDLSADQLSQGNGSETNTASGSVDENALTRTKIAQVVKAIPGGEEGNGKGSGLLIGERGRSGNNQACVDLRDRSKARLEKTKDALTEGETRDVGTQLDDLAGAFQTQGTGLTWVHTQDIEDIAEVETCSANGDANVTRSKRSLDKRSGQSSQSIQATRGKEGQMPGT
jgi:hypothetical protein